MTAHIFVTGTDTEIGKTHVSTGLLRAFNALGHRTLGLKPVSAGCEEQDGQLINEDALQLQAAASVKRPLSVINPLAFKPPISPNIAAMHCQQPLTCEQLIAHYQQLSLAQVDICISEGAGGWCLPLNATETLADFVTAMQFTVILVVGLKLGCLNHTLLTYQSLLASGANICGWVGNSIDPNMLEKAANIETIKQWLPIPCLGIVDHAQPAEQSISMQYLMKLLNMPEYS